MGYATMVSKGRGFVNWSQRGAKNNSALLSKCGRKKEVRSRSFAALNVQQTCRWTLVPKGALPMD
jgi:hypothetical protein